MKNLFSVQPYAVGSKTSKSLAIVIPSEVVKKYQINTSTVFVLRGGNSEIVLSFVDIDNNENETIPYKESQVLLVFLLSIVFETVFCYQILYLFP
jgi:hypothetical protein